MQTSEQFLRGNAIRAISASDLQPPFNELAHAFIATNHLFRSDHKSFG
ncbi:hypothetical protein CEV34_2912 [Brucella pseudogrignonensis]|uniref:Uncharacterized protein n=1 Tax=Brucella pseudogrignonensis TaxID=419475 RepID=A0A256GDZ7_9HYPH|nr:hypothetical protein CEV34_2912 [Brucella pseudogrignonensis]